MSSLLAQKRNKTRSLTVNLCLAMDWSLDRKLLLVAVLACRATGKW